MSNAMAVTEKGSEVMVQSKANLELMDLFPMSSSFACNCIQTRNGRSLEKGGAYFEVSAHKMDVLLRIFSSLPLPNSLISDERRPIMREEDGRDFQSGWVGGGGETEAAQA